MARFYASVKGDGKQSTKMGQRRISAHIRSWDHGIKVKYYMDEKDNAYCDIHITGGSNSPNEVKIVKHIKLGQVSNRRPGQSGIGGIGNN